MQQTFDMVCEHFARMQVPAFDRIDGTCVYRVRGTKKANGACFAGCLIEDRQYDPRMEGLPANSNFVSPTLRRNGHDVFLVRQMQQAHDNVVSGRDVLTALHEKRKPKLAGWKKEVRERLIAIAKQNGLSIVAPSKRGGNSHG